LEDSLPYFLLRNNSNALAGYDLPILTARMMQRVIYPTSAAEGVTVFESEPRGDAAKEIRALKAEILQLLN